jgi:hypothetical protein
MIAPTQDLGRFDYELMELDRQIAVGGGEGILLALQENPRRFGLSRLWVLGAYELVRCLDSHIQRSPRHETVRGDARALKRQFERLRMPLAKFETARNFPDDWPIAYPGYEPQTSAVAWQVGENTFIQRNALSEDLLAFLETLAQVNRD